MCHNPSHDPSHDPPRSPLAEKGDQQQLRNARNRYTGFAVGQYLQPPPMLFSRDGHNLWLGDMYRGHTAFLVCGGPSLLGHDLAKIAQRGVLVAAVNNAATVVRPHLWISVDDPGNFSDAIWRDPGVMKFVPLAHMEKRFMVRDEFGALIPSEALVGEMPAVCGFRRNEAFLAHQWLHEDSFNWGNHGSLHDAHGNKGSRSVMYVALRLLFYLGIRQVFLLGCDFKMHCDRPNYAFKQDRTKRSVKGNNSSYQILNNRFTHLKPHFEAAGFHVFNCTRDSGLTAFPYLDYDEAVETAAAVIPGSINTIGMYDRRRREKDAEGSSR